MDKFLETYNLPRLNYEEMEKLNRMITRKETELISKNLSTNRSPEPDGFTGGIYQTFKVELIPNLLKHVQEKKKKERKENTSKLI